jgi:hypothetical protein
MRRISAVVLAMALASVQPAEAHQLDEYLQATRIAIERDRIVLEINLTPGAAVAEQIIAPLDRDGDRRIAGPEIEAYARMVLRDLVLELDSRLYPLKLARAESPAWHEMRDGLGTIRLEATAEALIGAGKHQLQFINRHRPDIGVYLVNALVPSSSRITIGEPQRDFLQHGIRLEVNSIGPYTSASWIAVPFGAVTALVVYRRRGHPARTYRGCARIHRLAGKE